MRMLQSVNHLHGFTIHAQDGELGAVKDVYLDEGHWTIRYLVVDTGKWLPGRLVLISPSSAKGVDWLRRTILVDLTCDQVRNSPDVATDKPVFRQHEEALSAYYGWPAYWTMEPLGFELNPLILPLPAAKPPGAKGDPHLRSAHELKGYHVNAVDGPVGHVSDFAFDDATWEIGFLIVDAGSWLHERLILVGPDSVTGIAWDERAVAVNLAREAVGSSPLFTPEFPISAEDAERTVEHYRRAGPSPGDR
jgi:uncharacterized protein YrrD